MLLAEPDPTLRRLFVYGTLRREARTSVAAHLRASCLFLGHASLQARLYRVATYPAAILSENPADTVHGDLLLLADPTGTFDALDRFEGWNPHTPETSEFRRACCSVKPPRTEHLVTAWVYLYNRTVTGLPRIASGDFLRGDPADSAPEASF